jgi:hypothetical protein
VTPQLTFVVDVAYSNNQFFDHKGHRVHMRNWNSFSRILFLISRTLESRIVAVFSPLYSPSFALASSVVTASFQACTRYSTGMNCGNLARST